MTNIVLNVILICMIGVQGAVIATVVSSYVIYICRKRATGDKIVSTLYNSIMIVWALLIAQSFVEIYLQNYYIQLAIFAIILTLINKPLIACIIKFKQLVKNRVS